MGDIIGQAAERAYPALRDIMPDGCCTAVTMNGEGNKHYIGLMPGQFDQARKILPDDLYAQIEALWTPEVIMAWKAGLTRSCI